MAMNIKGIRTRLEELLAGVEAYKEQKEDAIYNAQDRDEETDDLEAQLEILEEVLEALAQADESISNWE